MSLIEKVRFTEKSQKAYSVCLVLSCLVLGCLFCFFFVCFFRQEGEKKGYYDQTCEAKASKRLWAWCPKVYMFNDAHQNFAFHYLNIKLELHEHSP